MMQWTTTPPTEPGWYWWRFRDGDRVFPRQIIDRDARLIVLGSHGYDRPVNLLGGEWWPVRIDEPPCGGFDGR